MSVHVRRFRYNHTIRDTHVLSVGNSLLNTFNVVTGYTFLATFSFSLWSKEIRQALSTNVAVSDLNKAFFDVFKFILFWKAVSMQTNWRTLNTTDSEGLYTSYHSSHTIFEVPNLYFKGR